MPIGDLSDSIVREDGLEDSAELHPVQPPVKPDDRPQEQDENRTGDESMLEHVDGEDIAGCD